MQLNCHSLFAHPTARYQSHIAMSTYIEHDLDANYFTLTLGSLLSPVAYGIAIYLFAKYLRLHFRAKRRGACTKQLWFIFFHITVALIFASTAYIQGVIGTLKLLRTLSGGNIYDMQNSVDSLPFFIIPLSIINADFFMVRIIYYNSSIKID